MTEAASKLHFPEDIKLNSRPLVEAWLDIRWQLEPLTPQQQPTIPQQPQFMKDPGFPFAVGNFFQSVKDQFGQTDPLPAAALPQDIPYVVHHQFRPGKDKWPLLQLGPGVATVNFTDPYSWSMFREKALYLRSKLVEAYGDIQLKAQAVTLQYRNAIPFEFSSGHLLEFLKKDLNTSIKLPAYVPGDVGSTEEPTGSIIALTFNLKEPKGQGTIGFATASTKEKDPKTDQETELVVFDLSVSSTVDNAPNLYDENKFALWLVSAHAVIHEWFFSFIEGPLFQKYMNKGE